MDITTVIINYQTPDLLETAVRSFKRVYPQIKLLVLDNGSKDNSSETIKKLVNEIPEMTSLTLKENKYHGPAMDLAARDLVQTKYVFFLDSDTETLSGEFLEKMLTYFKSDMVYGVGEFVRINKRGFKSDEGLEILQTPYMLLDVEIYKSLPPFIHHGQPTLANFTEALERGYQLKDFKVSDYIFHMWRGTAEKFGYGLGWRGKLDYLLNKIGF